MKNYPTLLALAYSFLCSIALSAQTSFPIPDGSFNGSGVVQLETCVFFHPSCMCIQPDGKTLCGGFGNRSDIKGNIDGLLARLNPDGSVDTGFGTNGVQALDVEQANDKVVGISLFPGNKILVLLESEYRSYLVRLNMDGSPDLAFGHQGFLKIQTESYEAAQALLLQNDFKILILSDLGTPSKNMVTVRRCKPNGTLDTVFGENGRVRIDMLTQNFDTPKGVLQFDGKLLLTGHYGFQSASGFIAIRLNQDGSLDHTFSDDGIFLKGFGNNVLNSGAESITASPNGTIYLGGVAPGNPDPNLAVLSLLPNGALNTAFGTDGLARMSFGDLASARSLRIQYDGKIIAAGYCFVDPNSTAFVLARFNPDGSPDNTFGEEGMLSFAPFSQDFKLEVFNDAQINAGGSLTCLGWLRGSLDLSDHSVNNLVLHRFITNIKVKAEEPSAVFQELKVFPTLQNESSTLQLSYRLAEAGNINISLYDEKGAWIKTLITGEQRSAGQQQEACALPQNLPAGMYYVVLDNGQQVKTLKIFKF